MKVMRSPRFNNAGQLIAPACHDWIRSGSHRRETRLELSVERVRFGSALRVPVERIQSRQEIIREVG